MEIYLSSETEGRANSLLLPIRNMVDSLLNDIRKNEYGSALTSVGVFAIIMKEEMYDSGGYCERQYYSKVRKEADIRLRLNYNDSAQKTPAVRKNVRGMNAPITNNATIIPTGFSSGIVGFSWPDVLQNAVIRCIALLFQEKHFR